MIKKIFLVLVIAASLAACKQKEEQPIAPGGGVSPINSENQVKMLNEILRDDPKNLDAWIKLGNIMMDSNRFQQAVDAYGKALELNPDNVDVRVDMGTCLRNVGKPDKAAEEYRKAISINPRHPNAHRNLGVVLAFDFGDKSGGIKELETYLSIVGPDSPDAAQIKGTIAQLKSPTPK